MSPRRFAIAFLLALGLLPAGLATAGFAPVSEPIFAAEQTQAPAIAIDAAGNSIIAWSQEKALGDPPEARARRLSAGGTLGPPFDLDPGEISAQPAAGMTAGGRAFLAWQVRATELGPASVKGRWVEPGGALGPLLTLVEGKAGEVSAGEIGVVVDPAGAATVTWRNFEGNRIALRRVGADGTLGALLPDVSGAAAQDPQAAALPDGSTVVVWDGSGVETNLVGPSLAVGAPLKISTTPFTVDPQIAADRLGNALVVWRAGSGEYGAFARRLAGGVPVGGELAFDPLAAEFVDRVSVAADSANHFAVVWDRQDPQNEKRVLARGFSFDGGFTGPAATVSEAPSPASPGAFAALFDNGLGAVAWKRGAGSGTSFAGRQIDRAGMPTAAAQELFANSDFNSVAVASAAAVGAAAFLAYYPISGSAQAAVVRRFLAPPACTDSAAAAPEGRPIAVPISCAGPAIESTQVVDAPSHGGLGSFDPATLSFPYLPRPGFAGEDSFTYSASNDGGSSGVVRVTIAVGKETVKPRVKALKLVKKLRKRKPRRYSFKFRLAFSEPATARLTVKRVVRVHGKAKLRKVGTVRSHRLGERAVLPVRGRLARRLNAGGRFRAIAVATDPAQNYSQPKKRRFRVR